MIIDNKKATINYHLLRFLFLFLLAVIIIVLYSFSYFEEPIFGIDRNYYVLALVFLYLLYYLIGIVRNYQYIFFTDNGSKLVIRYYSLRPMSKRQNAVEIGKTMFANYKLTHQLMGFRKYLVLYQRLPNGSVVKYPPINVSIMKKEDLNQLTKALQSYRNI